MLCICLAAFMCNPRSAAAVTSTSPDTAPIQVVAPTNEELSASMLYGTRVVIPEGTKYYASADNNGSGSYGIIGNRYTPMGTDLYVGGFSLLNNSGRLTTYRAYNPPYVPVTEYWQSHTNDDLDWDQIWLAIYLDPEGTTPIGWVQARSVAVINGILGDGKTNANFKNGVIITQGNDIITSRDDSTINPDPSMIDTVLPDPGNAIEDRIIQGQESQNHTDQTSGDPFVSTREIAYAIEDYVEGGQRVALLLDASASVSGYVSDISSYGTYVDKVNRADEIIAFGKDFKFISAENYLSSGVNANRTDIYTPLTNLTDVSSYDRIIIVTDTYHNVPAAITTKVSDFKGKIVIVCTNDSLRLVEKFVIADIENAFGTTVYLCRLDNELDRIQAISTTKSTS